MLATAAASCCPRVGSAGLGPGGHHGRFCFRPGGHLDGRFCRLTPPPTTRRTYGDPRPAQISARGFSPHPGFPLDAPQRPSQSSQGYNLLLLIFTQDIAHARRLMLRSINVLAQFSMAGFEVTLHGRFWVTAEGEYAPAWNSIGTMYSDGSGVPKGQC